MGTLIAVSALAIILLSVSWNMGGLGRPLTPPVERAVASIALALSIGAIWFAEGLGESAVALLALALSGFALALTFLSGLPRQAPAITVGAPARDFVATDTSGDPFRLSDLRDTPVLLKLFRGSWCPYCVAELRDFDALATDFATLGVRLVAICPDRVAELAKLTRSRPWRIRLLADPANEVGRLYNVQNRNFTPKRGPYRELVIPTTVLVDAGGIVRWIDQARDFRQRSRAAVVLELTRQLLDGDVKGEALAGSRTPAMDRGSENAASPSGGVRRLRYRLIPGVW